MLRSSQIVTLLGVAVQLVGFLRTVIIAAALGVSLDVDAYNIAILAPAFITNVVGGWLQVSFVGRYAALVATGERHLAEAFRAGMLVLVCCIGVAAVAICWLFPVQVMSFFLPAGRETLATASAAALAYAGWMLLPTLLGDFLGLILNCHGYFLAAAAAPLVNAFVSVVALWLWHSPDLTALVVTLLIGSIAQLATILPVVARLGLGFPIRRAGDASSEVRATLSIALPLLPAIMFSNAVLPLVQFNAARLGEGVVAIYGYAYRLHGAVMQVLVSGLGTVLLPHFAALVARGGQQQVMSLLRRLARGGVLVTAYLAVGITLMGKAAVATLLARGRFDAAMASSVGEAWAILSLSLFPFAFGTYVAKLAQAMRHVYFILATSCASLLATLLVTKVGASRESLVILCLAPAAAVTAATVVWFYWLGRHYSIRGLLIDIVVAGLRTTVVLTPAVIGDVLFTSAWAFDGPDLLLLALRGAAFTTIAAAMLWLTGWYRWFLAKP